jgi:hypothetical protein
MNLSLITLALVSRSILPNLTTLTQIHTTILCQVPNPFPDSYTVCIVGIARATSAKLRPDPRASG